MRVLVTGVTGQVGSQVAAALASVDSIDVQGLVRREVAATAASGYTPIRGDLADPASLDRAVDGCNAVFIASSIHPDQVALQTNLIRAAAASGTRPTLVKLSGLGTSLDSFVDSGRWHAETEQAMEQSGLPSVALRPPFFMQNLRRSFQTARDTGVVRGQAAVEIAMIDVADIAAVAARCLIGKPHDGLRSLTITGPHAYSFAEVAQTMAAVLGRTVALEESSERDSRTGLEQAGMAPWHVDIMMQFRRAFDLGWGAEVTSSVHDILGRPPVDLAASLQAMFNEQATIDLRKTTNALDSVVQGI